jgi:transposase-like protein
MTKSAVEVITSVQRRRRWNAAEKERLVAATLEPGARSRSSIVSSKALRNEGAHRGCDSIPAKYFCVCFGWSGNVYVMAP